MTDHSEEYNTVDEIIRQEQAEAERNARKKNECPICGHRLFLAGTIQGRQFSRIYLYCSVCHWETPYRLNKTGE